MRNAGDRFNGSQAKELGVLGAPRMELGRPMELPHLGGPLETQQSQPIPTQGQQGFMGSRQGAAAKGSFVPMGGGGAIQTQRPQPRPAPAAPQASPELSGGEEVHTIDVHGVDAHGNELVATFDAVFPRGSRILGAQERR
jgi:hypothetical protein